MKKNRVVFIVLLAAMIALLSFASASAASNTGIDIVNLSNSSGTVAIEFFDASGTSHGTVSDTISAFGSLNFYIPTATSLAPGQYSAVVSSQVPVAASVGLADSVESQADNYLGTSDPNTDLSFPLVYRNHNSWVSQIIIQNATGSAQTVDIEVFPNGSTTAAATDSTTIQGFSYHVFDMADYTAFGNTFGAAVVTGQDLIAGTAIHNLDKGSGPSGKAQMAYRAFTPNQVGQTVLGPLFYRGHGGFETGVNVLNTSTTTATDVTAKYTFSGGAGGAGGPWSYTKTNLQPGEQYTFYGPVLSPAMNAPIYGSVEVTSSATDIVVVISHSRNVGGNIQAFAYEGAIASIASPCVAAPIVQNRATTWKSGINIFNTSGTNATVKIDYASSNPATSDATQTITVNANSPKTVYMPTDGTTQVNFYGGAKIQATSGENLLVLATTANSIAGVSVNYMGVNYTCP